MPDATRVLTAIRNDLETAGLIRRPSTAGTLPALLVEPRNGPPAPGELEGAGGDLAVTIRLSSEAGARAGAAHTRTFIIDLIYRSVGTAGLKAGRTLDSAIRARLVQTAGYGTGVMLDAGGPAQTFAHEIAVFGGLGPLSVIGDVQTEMSKLSVEVLAA